MSFDMFPTLNIWGRRRRSSLWRQTRGRRIFPYHSPSSFLAHKWGSREGKDLSPKEKITKALFAGLNTPTVPCPVLRPRSQTLTELRITIPLFFAIFNPTIGPSFETVGKPFSIIRKTVSFVVCVHLSNNFAGYSQQIFPPQTPPLPNGALPLLFSGFLQRRSS